MKILMNLKRLIQSLGLEPHPVEGGFFRETYRSRGKIPAAALAGEYKGERNHSTAIYYLLTPDTFSEMHCLPTDEVFHFYLGDAVEMLQLYPAGESRRVVLGPDVFNGQQVQAVVPAGIWQGCRLRSGGGFALLGCTVAPGFDFRDYRRGVREDLLKEFPGERDLIIQLTKEGE
ncbi:MAG: cupin domain-containing protein [Candidatus Omnitrophica bacterium]|nr:cupin domain-containing protein [Candidatus Omnitrophota bacterium]